MDPVDQTPTEPVDYAAISAMYASLLGALLLAARERGEEPVRPEEALPLGVATFALAKLVGKEKVETWLRRPFVEERPEGRRPRGRRMRYAVGELLSCTRCLGAWSSLGLVALRVARPRESRVVTTVLATSALNDWLQAGFAWLAAQATATEHADPE